ncbi:AarF/ABC1/UbiB kinase family protein [Romboutsia maritimum]|uniref:AarF/ABC1/UbiB kinase family protein n=2 Tax=Romboutsia maritimum TaxID=2020948 RepID=A0A371IRF1_9FIRM|nr:AarF/ABC1/UbiB kinase family protein [Romboutsia maritimum]
MVMISYKNLKRYRDIAHILIKYGFSFIVEKLNIEGVAYRIPITNPPEEIKAMSTGEKIRRVFEELGPTYVKLGQILSTRKDLLDQDIIDELSKLRDSVEEFSTYTAREIFIEELGLSVDDVFAEFNNEPMAAASIGQVYEAVLKSGEQVIVKIQRPNIEETIKSDLEILRTIVKGLKDLKKDIDIDLGQIIEEFQIQLLRELDYNFEAINAIKFKQMFKDSEMVYIPQVYSQFTTRRVLVMEKIIGVKLSDIDKINKMGWDTKAISEIGVKSFFKQVFEHGFFHADPHPGNIFVLNNRCISYIDFGMIGIIDKKTLNILNEVALAVIDKNVDKIMYLMMEIDAIDTEDEIAGIRQDLLYLIHYYYDVPLEKISIGDILNEIFRFFRTYKVTMPSQLATLAKTVITLEGTARELNPEFSVSSMGKEYIRYYYVNKFSPERIFLNSKNSMEEILLDLKTIPRQLRVILRNLEKNKVKINIEDIEVPRLETRIADLATQLSLSLVLASIVVGSSLIIASPNIEKNVWIKYMAIIGFSISFIIGILLVIKIFRTQYKKK